MEFEISNLEANNVIYFSEDGVHFSLSNSVFLRAHKRNFFFTPPDSYFLFQTDLLKGDQPVGDGEIRAEYSDWHEKIIIDDEVFFVPSPLMYRKVGDFLMKSGREDQ